jgi:hypothetical protein
MARRKFSDMQSEEQRYAAGQSQAHALREVARSAEAEQWKLTAPRRSEGQGHVTAEFGPHSDRDQARVDQLQATARDARKAADRAEAAPKPEKKRGWFR